MHMESMGGMQMVKTDSETKSQYYRFIYIQLITTELFEEVLQHNVIQEIDIASIHTPWIIVCVEMVFISLLSGK